LAAVDRRAARAARKGHRGGLLAPEARFFRLFRDPSEDGGEFFRLYYYVEDTWTLQDIFERGLVGYLRRHKLPLFLHKAAQAIRRCRTAALGGHVLYCPKCADVEKVFYNSCGHRACPQCAYLRIEQWLERKAEQLLACDHYHVTFTIPQQLHRLWRYDYRAMTALGFQAVRDTLFDLAAALPGLHVTFHSWNRALLFFPHFHALLTGGGLGADGTWKPCRKSLAATEVMAIVFKAKLRDGFRKLLREGKLVLPPDTNEQDALWLLEQALSRKWVVDRSKPYRHGKGVLSYFARYTRGGPLKNRRIESVDDETVTFRKNRHKEPYEAITVSIEELVGRILQHVPPPRFRTSRAYGLYAPVAAEKREICRAALGQLTLSVDDPEVQAEIPRAGEAAPAPDTCPKCGRLMVVLLEVPRPRSASKRVQTLGRPPPEWAEAPRGVS
jgi:hypothetical protein